MTERDDAARPDDTDLADQTPMPPEPATGLAGRSTGETAGYTGGRAMGTGGAAGMRQIQADDAAPGDVPDANMAQEDS